MRLLSSHRRLSIKQTCTAVAAVILLLSWNGSTFAQDALPFCATSTAAYCVDFDEAFPEGATLFGAVLEPGETGTETNGFLRITNNTNWSNGTIVFPAIEGTENQLAIGGRTGAANSNHHVDNIELNANGDNFRFEADVRIGGGTRRPADGMSFNFARPGDPVLETGEGYAEIAAHNFPEEGTQTGLAVAFDEWSNTEPWDVTAISVRYEDEVLAQFPYPTLNGKVDDPTSLHTGPNETPISTDPIDETNQTQSIGVELNDLAWTRLTIERDSDDVTVTYKGNTHVVDLGWAGLSCNSDRAVTTDDLDCITMDRLPDLLDAVGLLAGDFDLNGSVNFNDFLTLANNFGNDQLGGVYTNGDADLNDSIEFRDFLTLATNFGTTRGAATAAVPEPSTARLLLLACLMCLCGGLGRFRRESLPTPSGVPCSLRAAGET